MSAEIMLECIHCANFFKCTLKETKITDRCVNFEERKTEDGRRQMDKDSN